MLPRGGKTARLQKHTVANRHELPAILPETVHGARFSIKAQTLPPCAKRLAECSGQHPSPARKPPILPCNVLQRVEQVLINVIRLTYRPDR